MKLSDFKDEAALDLLAEIIDPAAEIFSDTKIANILRNNGAPAEAVKIAIRNHKKSVIQIMAAMEGVPFEEYHCNVFSLPIKLLEILNDKELVEFFTSQGQIMEEKSSGSATVNTKVKEK